MKLVPVCFILLLSLAVCDDCMPLYWQVSTDFSLANDEVSKYAQIQLNPSDRTKSATENATKVVYNINKITPKQLYNGKNISVIGNGTDTITVNNNIVNIEMTYFANKTTGDKYTAKGYNGTGTATVNNMVVNFTKKLATKAGVAAFELLKYSFDLPNDLHPTPFIPSMPNNETNTTFWKMVTDDVYLELKNTVNASLNLTLTKVIKEESFPNSFGGESYVYTYRDTSLTFASRMQSVDFLPEGGLIVGYDMSIVSWTSNCSKFKPIDMTRTSSYISYELIQSLIDYVSKNSQAWSLMTLNGKNMQSSVFQFYMADLEDIIPKAVEQYPSLVSKTYANCTIDPKSVMLSIDTTYKLIKVSANWGCSLYLEGADAKLLDLVPEMSYEIKLVQESDQLKAVISSALITGCTWKPLDDFPIQNEKLANFYLKSLGNTFVGQVTLGSGFAQPKRKVPIFEFFANYIRISDGATVARVR